MIHILYNPLAADGRGETPAKALLAEQKSEAKLQSVIDLDMKIFLSKLTSQDKVILCGGDGTVNRFANDTYGMDYPCDIYLYKSGTGNDFLRDVEGDVKDNMLLLNKYIENLPTVTVKGETKRFINGIGYGIDGMVCEVADRLKAEGKKVDYSKLSIKLLLHGYRCPDAVVTVDGKRYEFKKVWLASGMNGRYYGGGMKITPDQDRFSDKLSTCIVHSSGKLKTLMIFPSIFKGEHIKNTKITKVLTGKEITVEFSVPTALQIDGETVLGVSSYTIRR